MESREAGSSSPWMEATALMVSSDPVTGRIWGFILQQRHIQAIQAEPDEASLQRGLRSDPSLVLVDLNLGRSSEINVCRRLRPESPAPIILFTACSEEDHFLSAYESGVDDCVSKPVSPALFMAKVQAWLRHAAASPRAGPALQAGNLRLDPIHQQVTLGSGQPVRLTHLEFRLLRLFMTHPAWVLEPDDILQQVWGCTEHSGLSLVKNVVYRLRQKIEADPHCPQHIQTEPGLGYRFEP